MTYAECIGARRLLGLTQTEVAKAIGVGLSVISAFETSGHLAKPASGRDRKAALRAYFEGMGIEFPDGGGVRLRQQNTEQ